MLKALVRRVLPYAVVKRLRSVPALKLNHVMTGRRRATAELEACFREFVFPDLPPRPRRCEYLEELIGTGPSEAMYMLNALHGSMRVPGDVCEFGVAQGATSALLANELLESDRDLWLIDSFRGLSAPTEKDVLIDDIFGLGSMKGYKSTMAYGREEVLSRLAAAGFPAERTHIVAGFMEEISPAMLPPSICFAYIDMDLYGPVARALELVDERMSPGGAVVVDDYAFFSSGPKTAVEEFLAARPGLYDQELPRAFAGHFIVLRKTA
jgi:O-methyltransferase